MYTVHYSDCTVKMRTVLTRDASFSIAELSSSVMQPVHMINDWNLFFFVFFCVQIEYICTIFFTCFGCNFATCMQTFCSCFSVRNTAARFPGRCFNKRCSRLAQIQVINATQDSSPVYLGSSLTISSILSALFKNDCVTRSRNCHLDVLFQCLAFLAGTASTTSKRQTILLECCTVLLNQASNALKYVIWNKMLLLCCIMFSYHLCG